MKRARPDFPFYNGWPAPVAGRGWLAIIASLVIAFALLVLMPWRAFPLNLVLALQFVLLPLIVLRGVVGPAWTALFRRVGFMHVALMALFAVITLVDSGVVGIALKQFFTLAPNPVVNEIGNMSPQQLVLTLLPTVPQLIGEELIALLPFLAVLWVCVTRLRLSRRAGVLIALVVSSLIFGAAHLPTYDWNWAQALIGIGSARILLTLAYIATRNLWVSAGAHILNDWAGFFFAFLVGHVPMGGGD